MYSYYQIAKAAGFPTCGPQCRSFMLKHFGADRVDSFDLAVEVGKAFKAHKAAIAARKANSVCGS